MKDSDKIMTDIEHIIWDIRDGLEYIREHD